jgi:DNA invertase Pin-like site-specific DNA recombinase
MYLGEQHSDHGAIMQTKWREVNRVDYSQYSCTIPLTNNNYTVQGHEMTNYIAYTRVSTKKQGSSGLGLEAQSASVINFVNGHGKLVATYTEIESGRKSDRPELTKALAHAKRSKAILVVAKMDRLSRNLAFLSTLLESSVEFVAVDNPHANRLTVHILAAIAEHEAKATSTRTKEALAAAKARGTKLGSNRPGHWEGREHLRRAGLEKATQAAAIAHHQHKVEVYADLVPVVTDLRNKGLTLQAIASRLNELGHETRRGKAWNHVQVLRLLRA